MTNPDPAAGPASTGEPTPDPKGAGAKPDENTDWKSEARKWENRAKANLSAADELEKLKEAEKTELQKLTERAEAAERGLASEKVARLRSEVAADKGVPAASVTGSTREEMEASAEALLSWRGGSGTSTSSGGGFGSGASTNDSGLTGREKAASALRRMRK